MMVPIEKVFLRNQQLQKNPQYQKESPFYKKVRDSMKKKGMVNPLLCIQEGDRYKNVVLETIVILAASLHELGHIKKLKAC